MGNTSVRNIKLGVFVLAGLLFLIILLYVIGKNQNLFGANFQLKARFPNVQGLTSGNNIRFSGIQAGTVREITVLNDTTIEVVMLIKSSLKKHIRKNALVSIGTDGLVGNKVVNILPVRGNAAPVQDGDILACQETIDTDRLLQKLAKTSEDISDIAADLKITVHKISNSKAIWELLDDKSLPEDIRTSAVNIKLATAHARDMTNALNLLVTDIKQGKGSLGALITDTALASNLNLAIEKMRLVGDEAYQLANNLNMTVDNLNNEITTGKGPVAALLKDSVMAANIANSLQNIEKGTNSFNELLEAARHNILFRSYFRKQERQKKNAR
jgi:phospholipid/cholesterol/gamma-HCH transport system substrate-binding protein